MAFIIFYNSNALDNFHISRAALCKYLRNYMKNIDSQTFGRGLLLKPNHRMVMLIGNIIRIPLSNECCCWSSACIDSLLFPFEAEYALTVFVLCCWQIEPQCFALKCVLTKQTESSLLQIGEDSGTTNKTMTISFVEFTQILAPNQQGMICYCRN